MKARTLDPQVKVYSSTDDHAMSIATLPAGTEIDFGSRKRVAGKLWVPITLSTGQQAFIPGEARIQLIQQGALMQNKVEMRAEPTEAAFIKQTLLRNTKLYILQTIRGGTKDWVKVRDMTGNEGYIPGETRIRVLQQNSKAMGAKNIRTGIMWLIAGMIVLFSGNEPVAGSMYNWFGYIAAFFGGSMLILGLVQYLKSRT